MNILVNTNFYRNGGIEREVEEFGKYIENETHHRLVTVVADPSKPEGRTTSKGVVHYNLSLPDKVTPSQLYSEATSYGDFRDRLAPMIKSLSDIIAKEKIDLSVSQGTFYLPWCTFQASLETDIPRVQKYAGVLAVEEKYKPTTTDKMRALFDEIEGSFNHPDVFTIFPSELTRKTVREIYGDLKGDSVVIPNGVSQEFFEMKRRMSEKNSVGFVGRYASIKNPEFMLKFANYLDEHNIPLNVHMVTNKDKVDCEFPSNVKFHEPMNTISLREFYQMVDVVLSPSYFETYGNVPPESVASSTPALISNNMGVGEVFRDIGLENFIVDFNGDVGEVVDKVRSTIDLRHDLGSARETLRTNYSWENIFKRIVDVCDDVAA